jgi:hypothetical protein
MLSPGISCQFNVKYSFNIGNGKMILVIGMKSWMKYAATMVVGATVMAAAYFLPGGTFMAFVVGWLFLIPATFAVYMLLGLKEHMKDRKNKIVVSVKPNEAMRALARKEVALQKEKEMLLEELQNR